MEEKTDECSEKGVRSEIVRARGCESSSGQLFGVEAMRALLGAVLSFWQGVGQRLSGMMIAKTTLVLVFLYSCSRHGAYK